MYEYRAKVLRVIDGDTIEVIADLGFDVSRRITLRLYGIDAPELSISNERERGLLAKQYLETELALAQNQIEIKTFADKHDRDRTDGFRRYLAIVRANGVDLNLALVQNGLASQFLFKKKMT